MYKNHFKRIMDIIFGLILLVVAVIPMGIAMILILTEGRGCVIFKQRRVGKDGKVFNIYKLRTMLTKTHHKDGRELTHEERVTKLGRFLRKTSIDELPQVFNILKGDMSFVGPRPWMEDYFHFFTKEQKRRAEVKPGITGWAQVKGRNAINILEKINYDIWYVENVSFKLDIKILILTALTVLSRHGVEISQEGIKEEIRTLKEHKAVSKESKVHI